MYECEPISAHSQANTIIILYFVFSACFVFSLICFVLVIAKLVKRLNLGSKFIFIQLQISVCIVLSETFLVLGLLLSPCQPLSPSYASPDQFAAFCLSIGALQGFTTLALFSWMALLNINIANEVAQECLDEILRRIEQRRQKRRLSLEERAMQNKSSTMSKEGPRRKISHDLLELWKQNIEQTYNQEMEEAAEQEKKANQSIKAVKTFTKFNMPYWALLCLGYLSPAIVTALTFATRPEVDLPTEGDPFQWEHVIGLDLL